MTITEQVQELYSALSLSNGQWEEVNVNESFYWSFIEPVKDLEGRYILSDRNGAHVQEGTFRIELTESRAFIHINNEKYLMTFPRTDQEIVFESGVVKRRLTLIQP